MSSASPSASPSPWKMNKAELVERLESMGVPYRREWTLAELRVTLMEELEVRGLNKNKPMGTSHLSLEELKKKCTNEGIALPE